MYDEELAGFQTAERTPKAFISTRRWVEQHFGCKGYACLVQRPDCLAFDFVLSYTFVKGGFVDSTM